MPSKPCKQPTPARESPVSCGDDNANVIYPRRKAGQSKKTGGKAGVIVTLEVLEQVFDLPLHRACKTLGVCATAFKKVCRKLGVMKWPYKDNHLPPKRKAASRRRQLAQERAAAAAAARVAARAVSEAAQSDAPTEVAEPDSPKVKVEHGSAPADHLAATQDLSVAVKDEEDDEDEDEHEEEQDEIEAFDARPAALVSPGAGGGYTASSEGDGDEEMCDVATPEEMLGLYNNQDPHELGEEEEEEQEEDPMGFFVDHPPHHHHAHHESYSRFGERREHGEDAAAALVYDDAHGGLDELFPMKDVWQNATAPTMGEILGC